MTDENCETKMAAVTGSSGMIPVEEALKMVLNASQQLPPIKVSSTDQSIHPRGPFGKILAEGVKLLTLFLLLRPLSSVNGDASYLSQIRDSNRATLLAATSQQECQVLDIGIVCDIEQDIARSWMMQFLLELISLSLLEVSPWDIGIL